MISIQNVFAIRALLLSEFDDRIGPVIRYCLPSLNKENQDIVKNIPRFMDIMEHDRFFIHSTGTVFTANYLLEITSSKKRGRLEQVLISIVFRFSRDGDNDYEKLMIFLQKQRLILERMASIIKKDQEFIEFSLFSVFCESKIKRLMYIFYTEIFVENARELNTLEDIRQRIWVINQGNMDITEVLETLRTNLQILPHKAIKAEIMLLLIHKLEFKPYYCQDLNEGLISCDSCRQHFEASDAIIFLYTNNDPNAIDVLESFINHIKALISSKPKPFLVLKIKASDNIKDENNLDSEILVENVFYSHDKHDTIKIQYASIDLFDSETYYNPLKWILDELVMRKNESVAPD